MTLFDCPVTPDFEAFRACIRREKAPARVHYAELSIDGHVKETVARQFDLEAGLNPADPFFDLRRDVRVLGFLGYDLVRVHCPDSEFRVVNLESEGETEESRETGRKRGWVNEHAGPVQTWEDFERYPWPDPARINTAPLEWIEKNLPDGMAAYDLTMQVFEATTWLMGFESLAMRVYEDPEFVDALIEKIGSIYLGYTRLLCQCSRVGVIWGTDDLGFKSQTFLAPDWLREKILPWHRRAAELAHEEGKLYFLHSCGNVEAIFEDLIEHIGIDAKHSFEDVILPVTEAKRRYGARIGILGGMDVDFLCRSSEAEVRRRVRETLEVCQPGGGYALGSGNSLAAYIPVENCLAMLDEGRRFGR
jgi:uroporphyrinogen decarboxylase